MSSNNNFHTKTLLEQFEQKIALRYVSRDSIKSLKRFGRLHQNKLSIKGFSPDKNPLQHSLSVEKMQFFVHLMYVKRAAIFHHLQKNTEIWRRTINPSSLCLTVTHSTFYFVQKSAINTSVFYTRLWKFIRLCQKYQKFWQDIEISNAPLWPKYSTVEHPNFFLHQFPSKPHYVNDC